MICPKCREAGKRSKVYPGGTVSTLMALPSRQILEDPAWQRRISDGLLGYPRRPWQHVLCWLGFRRRMAPSGFPAFGSFGHRMIRDVRARGRYDQSPLQ